MAFKRSLSITLLIFAASVTIAGYWHFRIYRASELRIPVLDGQVDLSPLGNDWETLCILGPYAYNSTAKDVVGIEIDIESRSRSSKYDSFVLLVTIDDRGDYRLFDVPRHPSDFVNLNATCWPKGTEFRVDPEAPWHYVVVPSGG